jgi:hypothetical protein
MAPKGTFFFSPYIYIFLILFPLLSYVYASWWVSNVDEIQVVGFCFLPLQNFYVLCSTMC